MKNLADYLFCLTSPRHAERQRTRLEESKEDDALPKLCNLALESKSNVYARLDSELYQDIKSDLRVQCILYRNSHIRVDDASKFNVRVKFDCTKLHSSYDCKGDGYYYGCHWFKKADMYSPQISMPVGPQIHRTVPLPELIKERWAQRAIDFKIHQHRLRMQKRGWTRPGICQCMDPTSESCSFK